jgi:stage III sporulation protein AA
VKNLDEQLMKLLGYFPKKVSSALTAFLNAVKGQTLYVSEIRLRANAPMSVSFAGRNILRFDGACVICNEAEVAETLQKLCEDSVHTYSETLKEGYVMLENGYRIGVCGRANISGDSIRSVYGMTSLSIRIPHPVSDISGEILRHLDQGDLQSALLYAPPNVGKTTLIRDMAATLSKGNHAKRVALVDTRGEIYMKSMFAESIADVLHGYPRAKGIEIATRTLSPEVIFCDEIGSAEEAQAILSAGNSGVPLIATAHAESFEMLLKRPNIRFLYDHHIFRYYIGLSRKEGTKNFLFDVFDAEKEALVI